MNYLEHEIEVKYVDGLLARSQEWQWLITQIEKTFEIKKINSWDDFRKNNSSSRNVLSYFIKILETCDKDWIFSKEEFQEMWLMARYYIGTITIQRCINSIYTLHGKTMLLCIWLTKLKNIDNGHDNVFDIDILRQKNYHTLVNIESIIEQESQIIAYASNIQLEGIEKPIKCLSDNIKAIDYSYSEDFFNKYKNNLLNYNAFSFQTIDASDYMTWQEAYLLDMLYVSVSNRNTQSLSKDSDGSVSNDELWTIDVLKTIKAFFNHNYADFILDTVMYVKHNIEPSMATKIVHCKLLLKALHNEYTPYKIFSSSSYKIISYLFKDKLVTNCDKDDDFINLINQFQKWDDPRLIMHLKQDAIPINKRQKFLMIEYYNNKYKQIDNVDSEHKLLEYLRDEDSAKMIDTEYLIKVSKKFNTYIDSKRDLLVSSLFYQYMIFLISVNAHRHNVDVRLIHSEMIRIQKLWEDKYFKKQSGNLKVFSHKQKFSSEEVERYNDLVLLNPVIFANYCIPCTEDKILKVMEDISNNILLNSIRNIELNPIFPKEVDSINLNRHDIDQKLLEYINNLQTKKGYKFLNNLEPEKYVRGIHEHCKFNTHLYLSLFYQEKELYEIIKEHVEIELLPYSEDLTFGLLAQLFPILEIKIRELVTMLGIFPFKKNKTEFMQANDPSSLLREILESIYENQHSFENVPDFLYIYNIMYNSNSYNIRNECVHGRKYLTGGELRFAFRATLFAVYMVIFRIDTIKSNVSDLTEKNIISDKD